MNIFCHANGFPPESYNEIFRQLNHPPKKLVLAPLKRPFGPDEHKRDWNHIGDEVIKDLQDLQGETTPSSLFTGIGHSMGAVLLLRAAIKHPEWFKKLILIDPTFLPEPFVFISNYFPRFLNREYHPVASKAFRRRDAWTSKQQAYDLFRQKKLFSKVSDESLWNYVNSAIEQESSETSATLRYSKPWEEHCFLKVINVWPLLKKCSVPIVGITGEHSELMRPAIIERWSKYSPASEIHTIKATGHLVALERPKDCAKIINQHC